MLNILNNNERHTKTYKTIEIYVKTLLVVFFNFFSVPICINLAILCETTIINNKNPGIIKVKIIILIAIAKSITTAVPPANNKYQPAPSESIPSFTSFITCSVVVNKVKEELYFIEQKQKKQSYNCT